MTITYGYFVVFSPLREYNEIWVQRHAAAVRVGRLPGEGILHLTLPTHKRFDLSCLTVADLEISSAE